jgi:glycosyltransferase involved in cell wall biosynthesis
LVKNFPPLRTEPNTARIVKHLGRLGWRVDVLHALPGRGEAREHLTRDEVQLAELGDNIELFPVPNHNRLRGLEQLIKPTPPERFGGGGTQEEEQQAKTLVGRLKNFYRSLTYLPDKSANWLPTALRHGLRLIRRRRPALLLTSGPPFTNHLAGRLLKALTGIPWTAHFRDLFRENPLYEHYSDWRLGFDRALERWVVRGADAVTTVYPEATELLRQSYGRPGQLFRTIRNGYDEDDFAWARTAIEREGTETDGRFTFLHGGRLAADESRGRTAYSLLAGFQRWLERRPELRNRVRLRLVGRVHPIYQESIERLRLDDVVSLEESVSIREMIRRELLADCLLIILVDAPEIWFTTGGKIYECARAGKPVLGIVPENTAARLIRQLNLGRVAPYGDVEQIQAALDEIYESAARGTLDYGGPARDAFVRRTSFAELAAEFIHVFRQVLDP